MSTDVTEVKPPVTAGLAAPAPAVSRIPQRSAEPWVFFNGEIKPYSQVHLGLMTHALHYGTGVFEGIRGYWNEKDEQLYLIKLLDHYRRMERSCRVLRLDFPNTPEQLVDITVDLVRRHGFREDVYVRPLAFTSSEQIGVRLHNLEHSFGIYVAPFGTYIDVDRGIRCMVVSWRRIEDSAAPARAKITGLYVNAALAKTEANENGYDESIVLTHDGHVAEGSAENLFIVRDGVLITPAVTDNILEGITRQLIVELARDELGLTTVERSVDRSELYVSDEVFLCGTGAQVSAVTEIDRRPVNDGAVGPVTERIQSLYFNLVKGNDKRYPEWRTPVY
ncbi:MAG: branched-chain amino acid transaminase [Candidatus Dormibacteria bacterium]